MILAVPRETRPGERRVAIVPDSVPKLAGLGFEVRVQAGAGDRAGASDERYAAKGAAVVGDAGELAAAADVLVRVGPPDEPDVDRLREGAALVALLAPHAHLPLVRRLAARRISAFALELVPRITRAQDMDILSSMSTVSGYRAAVLAAARLPRFFPLLMTAAGTIPPARVLVIGAGVAGLQAIATARRLGAVVEAYDTRPAVREQVESLGARFVDLPLEARQAQDAGGYATAQPEDFYRKQRELLAARVADSDAVITTALVPGKRAPVLVSAEMVKGMRPGSVIVDLAAEAGGNCELTEPGREVERGGILVSGLTDHASALAVHASQMFSRNVTAFVALLVRDRALRIDTADEIVAGTLLTHAGEVRHAPTRALLEAQHPA
ncbi:MAG: Re/Si-specific NAD(P)(+) transhydrogenase subunit alpha [Planctomycetia bacterium]|nr:Re/Si-specific NAD(P)(+) transhydrogenase subunit alpha [Planctomycetia bacterium]